MYKHILVAVDGSDLSNRAVDHAARLAKAVGARATAIYVLPHTHFDIAGGEHRAIVRQYQQGRDEELKRDAQALLDKAVARGGGAGTKMENQVVFNDSPYAGIIESADKLGCDLIIMASHGYRGLNAVLLGSETTKVLTHSKVPVLVVR